MDKAMSLQMSCLTWFFEDSAGPSNAIALFYLLLDALTFFFLQNVGEQYLQRGSRGICRSFEAPPEAHQPQVGPQLPTNAIKRLILTH